MQARRRGSLNGTVLDIEIAYTPGSLYLSETLRKEEFRSVTPEPTMFLPMWKISVVHLQVSLFLWGSIAALELVGQKGSSPLLAIDRRFTMK